MAEEFNLDERSVLRLAESLKDLAETKPWRAYVELLEAQIKVREELLLLPLSALPVEYRQMDAVGRAMAMEGIKGAVLGLRLAISNPASLLAHAAMIRDDHSPNETENVDG